MANVSCDKGPIGDLAPVRPLWERCAWCDGGPWNVATIEGAGEWSRHAFGRCEQSPENQ